MKREKLEQYHWDHHWDYFAEFCYYEMNAGGPDPHMVLAGHMARDCEWIEQLWRGFCYLGFYNVPTAEKFWWDWPWPKIVTHGNVYDWIDKHWDGIATRRERRCVRVKANMATFFESAGWYVVDLPQKSWMDPNYKTPEERYEEAYTDVVTNVKYFGRYVGFKYLEFGTRYCGFPLVLPDIRPKGGWSPRAMLSLLFPDRIDALMGDDRPENLAIANQSADEAIARLDAEYGVVMDRYIMQVLLCDYKQSYIGQRQFPGRSQDSELEYHKKIRRHFGDDTDIWKARSEIFPKECLGENWGWSNVREELGDSLRIHGYTWSDLLYDYMASKDDLHHPVKRNPPAVEPLFDDF